MLLLKKIKQLFCKHEWGLFPVKRNRPHTNQKTCVKCALTKRLVAITIFLLSAIWCQAQLSTNQKTQVTSMIATAVKILNKRIDSLEVRVKFLEDEAKKYNSVVIFDTANYFNAIKQKDGNYLLQLKTKQ
jgi:cell division protein FtsB